MLLLTFLDLWYRQALENLVDGGRDLNEKFNLTFLSLPLMKEEVRAHSQDLLEVSQLKMAKHRPLHHLAQLR